jgi:hypothetical protein
MQLLDNSCNSPSAGVRSNTSAVEVIKVNPFVQLVLLAGAVAGAGYFSIRFYKELQSIL